jgi:glutamate N-acetyltransferase/amino-acid N-acetyltransferase
MLAADGEGASKFVTVRVTGAKSRADAELAARTIAESPLVKTAIHGADPNWGRVLMAAGRSGARVKEEKCRLSIAGHELFSGERPAELDPKAVSKAMQGPEVTVELDLGLGRGESRIYTCDLTRDYITINADYHT